MAIVSIQIALCHKNIFSGPLAESEALFLVNCLFFVDKVFLSPLRPSLAMWSLGFVFHEIAFGLLSVFLPLYIVGPLKGSLLDVGIMIALAGFVAVPFAFFWGYLCDKTRRYRFFILLSFGGMTLFLYLFSLTKVIWVLVILYAVIAVFHVAHEAPKNVLISEYYSRPDWERSFASYEGLTEVGWLIGLVLGFVLSGFGLSPVWFILFCSFLNLAGLIASFFWVKDPLFIFERKLVGMEKMFDFAHRGFALASKAFDGMKIRESLRSESVALFCAGLLLFSFATNMLFTPLPVFFSESLSLFFPKTLSLVQSLVFVIFIFNTCGSAMGYFLVRRWGEQLNGRSVVKRANLVRGLLSLLLIFSAVWISAFTLSLAVLVLVVMGLVYGFLWISALSLSMELIPEGKAGLFNALVGLGAASGCLFGTLVAESYGFPVLFVVVSAGFLLSYVAFKTYTH